MIIIPDRDETVFSVFRLKINAQMDNHSPFPHCMEEISEENRERLPLNKRIRRN